MGPVVISEHPTFFAALVAILAASLAGSLHCAAMCGPIALLARGESRWHPAFYHLGRLTGYAGLGAAAGAFGAELVSGTAAGGFASHLQAGFAAVLALLLIATGLRWIRGGPPATPGGRLLQGALERGVRRSLGLSAPARNLSIGLLSVLLPCGWLYTFVLAAAGSGSALAGAAVLVTFWLGTVPVFALGTWLSRARWLPRPSGVWLKRGVGAAMIVLGLNSVHQHLGARPHAAVPAAPAAAGAPASADADADAGAPEEHHCH